MIDNLYNFYANKLRLLASKSLTKVTKKVKLNPTHFFHLCLILFCFFKVWFTCANICEEPVVNVWSFRVSQYLLLVCPLPFVDDLCLSFKPQHYDVVEPIRRRTRWVRLPGDTDLTTTRAIFSVFSFKIDAFYTRKLLRGMEENCGKLVRDY